MKRVLFAGAVVALTLAAAPAFAALAVGAKAPEVKGQAYLAGKATPFDLQAALKKGPVVLYFFPGAYTPGCNLEAKAFAEAADKYKALGATVVGLTGGFGTSEHQGPALASLDQAVKEFSTSHCNGKFPVMAASADTVTAYDSALAARPGWSNRTSYVITPDGKIALAYVNARPDGHVENTLKAIQDWKAGKK
jgi:peroxiredoxin